MVSFRLLSLGAVVHLVVGGCAAWDEKLGDPAGRGNAKIRDRPDDSNPGALVPAGVQTVIDLDMAQIRGSTWVAPALDARDQRVRAAKAETLGYDDVTDVDRLIYAVTAAGADAPTLMIAQGRFDSARVQDAFRTRWPGAAVDGWRKIPLLATGENAIALLTARTFVSGTPAMVRAVIDRAFGVGADISADPALGPTRRALSPQGRPPNPAILAAVAIDDTIRARVGDAAPMPRELREVGIRLDLGQDVEAQALGFLDDPESARSLARRLNAMLRNPMTQLTVRAMGLGMLLNQTRISADGARVLVRLSIAAEHRAQLAAMLKAVVESSGSRAGAGGFGSW